MANETLFDFANFTTILRGVDSAVASLIDTLGDAAGEFLKLEDSLTSISRVTGLAGKELLDFKKDIDSIARSTGTSRDSLLSLAEAAGQLGIEGARLVPFIENINKMSVALGLNAEQTALATDKFQKLFKLADTEILNFGNALNKLSDSSAASTQQLIDGLNFLAPIAQQFGLSVTQAASLSATLTELGVSSEVASTALQKIFSTMTRKTKEFAEVVGISKEEFANLVEADSFSALTRFAAAFNKLGAAQKTFVQGQLGLTDSRLQRVLNVLSGSTERLTTLTDAANQEFREGNSVNSEFAKKLNQTSTALSRLGETISQIKESAFAPFSDIVRETADSIRQFAEQNRDSVTAFFSTIAEGVQSAINLFKGFVPVIKDAYVTISEFVKNNAEILKIGAALGAVAIAAAGLATALGTLGGAVSAFGAAAKALIGIAGAASTGVGGIGAAALGAGAPIGALAGLATALAGGFVYLAGVADNGESVMRTFAGTIDELAYRSLGLKLGLEGAIRESERLAKVQQKNAASGKEFAKVQADIARNLNAVDPSRLAQLERILTDGIARGGAASEAAVKKVQEALAGTAGTYGTLSASISLAKNDANKLLEVIKNEAEALKGLGRARVLDGVFEKALADVDKYRSKLEDALATSQRTGKSLATVFNEMNAGTFAKELQRTLATLSADGGAVIRDTFAKFTSNTITALNIGGEVAQKSIENIQPAAEKLKSILGDSLKLDFSTIDQAKISIQNVQKALAELTTQNTEEARQKILEVALAFDEIGARGAVEQANKRLDTLQRSLGLTRAEAEKTAAEFQALGLGINSVLKGGLVNAFGGNDKAAVDAASAFVKSFKKAAEELSATEFQSFLKGTGFDIKVQVDPASKKVTADEVNRILREINASPDNVVKIRFSAERLKSLDEARKVISDSAKEVADYNAEQEKGLPGLNETLNTLEARLKVLRESSALTELDGERQKTISALELKRKKTLEAIKKELADKVEIEKRILDFEDQAYKLARDNATEEKKLSSIIQDELETLKKQTDELLKQKDLTSDQKARIRVAAANAALEIEKKITKERLKQAQATVDKNKKEIRSEQNARKDFFDQEKRRTDKNQFRTSLKEEGDRFTNAAKDFGGTKDEEKFREQAAEALKRRVFEEEGAIEDLKQARDKRAAELSREVEEQRKSTGRGSKEFKNAEAEAAKEIDQLNREIVKREREVREASVKETKLQLERIDAALAEAAEDFKKKQEQRAKDDAALDEAKKAKANLPAADQAEKKPADTTAEPPASNKDGEITDPKQKGQLEEKAAVLGFRNTASAIESALRALRIEAFDQVAQALNAAAEKLSAVTTSINLMTSSVMVFGNATAGAFGAVEGKLVEAIAALNTHTESLNTLAGRVTALEIAKSGDDTQAAGTGAKQGG